MLRITLPPLCGSREHASRLVAEAGTHRPGAEEPVTIIDARHNLVMTQSFSDQLIAVTLGAHPELSLVLVGSVNEESNEYLFGATLRQGIAIDRLVCTEENPA